MQMENGQIFGENRFLQFLAAAPGAADHCKLCFGQSARGHEIDGSLAGLRLRAWGSILATSIFLFETAAESSTGHFPTTSLVALYDFIIPTVHDPKDCDLTLSRK